MALASVFIEPRDGPRDTGRAETALVVAVFDSRRILQGTARDYDQTRALRPKFRKG